MVDTATSHSPAETPAEDSPAQTGPQTAEQAGAQAGPETAAQPPKRFFRRGAGARVASVAALSVLIICGVLMCYVQQPRLMRMLDYKVYDALLHTQADGAISPVPVIVDLDEASLAAYGQWPWPRVLLARLVAMIAQSGAASVGLDMLLSEKDRHSPARMREDLQRYLGVNVGFAGLPEDFEDYDALFASALGPSVVLGMYCHFSGASAEESEIPLALPPAENPATIPAAPSGDASNTPTDATGAALPAAPAMPPKAPAPPPIGTAIQKSPGAIPYDSHVNHSAHATLPLPLFWQVAPVGMINMNADLDGVVRRVPLVALYNGKAYASLSLRTVMAAFGQKALFLRTGPDGLESLRFGPYTIPVEPDGSFIVPYKGPTKTFPYYSAKDILEGTVGPDELKGKAVFLGTSAPGLLDIRITPLERVYPGVEVHASIASAILSQQFLRVPPWSPGAQGISIIVAGVLAAVAFGFARPKIYIPVAALLFGAVIYGSLHLFREGTFFSPLYVCLTVGLLGAFLLVLRFWQEEKQKNVLRSAFSRYVAPEVVARIARLEGDIFAGEERELSIMFTDIRGFTSISEKLTPQQIVLLLNRYFTPMTALVRGNKGTLDKFIGDALMAFWNAPLPVPEHPELAVRTALAMHETLKNINAELEKDFGVTVRMGVGVHTGKAYVGNMGSEELLNYTLIGDSVNLASRLEGLCSQFGVTTVVSAETRAGCAYDDAAFIPLDTLRVKGKKQPVSVFFVLSSGEAAERRSEFAEYEAAYAEYVAGNFTRAHAMFAGLANAYPDVKLYALYTERCETLERSTPENWDGVWTLTGK